MGICLDKPTTAAVARKPHSGVYAKPVRATPVHNNQAIKPVKNPNPNTTTTTHRGSTPPSNGGGGGGGRIITPNMKVFTLAELEIATRNFRADSLLGEGGFGKVFKGWIDEKTFAPSKFGEGMPVAVKKSNPNSEQGLQEWQRIVVEQKHVLLHIIYRVLQSWSCFDEANETICLKAEVNFLGKFCHPNLVKLIGYCLEGGQFLLVYEYMEEGSLEKHLFSRDAAGEYFPWETRMKIAIGAAKGLAFLHTTEKKVIFRDFKASNILLDWNFNAKLSDFGLAKVGPASGISHVSTRIIGTYGYAAPEYIATGHLYVKSDVYGFGVVLLEIITGLRVVDMNRPNGHTNLIEWAKPFLPNKRKLKKIMDPRLQNQYPSKAAFRTAELILKCLEPDQKCRPAMEQVLESLEQINTIKKKPRMRVEI